jgi:succinoglycan biosynthesis protein ExoM
MLIDVVIPTVDRQLGLKRAVLGVLNQHVPSASVRIVIVDNSPAAAQRHLFSELVATSDTRMQLSYVHEPSSGLAFARNRGVAESRGDFVVFLDDDESPVDSSWLATLVGTVVHENADASFGPIRATPETSGAPLSEFVARLHSRDLNKVAGADVSNHAPLLGTGNSCFRRSSCFANGENLFRHEFNHTGGEDVEFLRRLRLNNRRFVWASQATVHEFVPPSRLNSDYLSSRRFQQGQQRVYLQVSTPPRRYDAMVFWVAIGVAQIIYHFLARAIACLTVSHDAVARHNIQMWGGLGKVFWQRKHRRKNYGSKTESGDS